MDVLEGGGFDLEAIELAERVLAPVRSPQLLPGRVGAVLLRQARAQLALGQWAAADKVLGTVAGLPGFEPQVLSTTTALALLRGELPPDPELSVRLEQMLGIALDPFDDQPYMGDVVSLMYAVGMVSAAREVLTDLPGDPRDWRASSVWPALTAALRAEVPGGFSPRCHCFL